MSFTTVLIPKQLEGHQNKCRFCFRILEEESVEITNSIEKRFEKLTFVKLILADCYSNAICERCNSKLSEFSDFQHELIENQMKLYDFFSTKINEEEYIVEEFLENTTQEHNLDMPEPIEHDDIIEELIVSNANDQSKSTKPPKEEIEELKFEFKASRECLCNICGETFKTKNQLQLHKKDHKPSDKTQKSNQKLKNRKMCQLCGLSFAASGWYHHVLRSHTTEYRFYCDNCGKGYKLKNDLKEHIQKHMSVESRKKFHCAVCNAAFLSKSALKNHEKVFHSDSVEEHVCDCGKVFSSKMKLYQHRLTVHKKGHYPCSSCEKVYTVKAALQKHIVKKHSAKVPCKICGKMFAPGMFMNIHMKLHDPPQFKCSYKQCTRMFSSKSSLRYHIETQHNDGVEVHCPTCNASFSSIRNLNRHVDRQHNNYKVQCEVDGCTHTASRKDYLASHYRSHKDIDDNTRTSLLAKIKLINLIPW